MLLGHEGVVEAISSQLPSVSIISGPPSVGKRLIASYAAIKNNVDRIDFIEVKRLTVDEAKRVQEFVSTAPLKKLKFVLIDLDHSSTEATHKLLKVLENPPEYSRFSLITSQAVPKPLLTRSQKYSVGLLNPEQLKRILVSKGIPEAEASGLSVLGRVDFAMNTYLDSASKNSALNVLQAVESGDYVLFLQAYKAIDDKAVKVILEILQESASQTWKVHSLHGLNVFSKKEIALKVLNLWSSVNNARPTLAMKVTLESLLKGF